MAERRRRRPARYQQENDEVLSEGESQKPPILSAMSGSNSERGSDDGYVDLSEYESEEDDYKTSPSSEEEEEENAAEAERSNDRKEGKTLADNTPVQSAVNIRERGDGKEQSDNDLEPKNNFVYTSAADQISEAGSGDGIEETESPYIIPTKGNFFQHDNRSDKNRRGNVAVRNFRTRPDASRWLHDKYNEDEQTPKTHQDLIMEYGYDIRSEALNRTSGPRPSRGQRGGRGSRRPFSRRGGTRPQRFQAPVNSKEDPKEWPGLNDSQERQRQSKYSEYRIRSQDFTARRRNSPRGFSNRENLQPNSASKTSRATSSKEERPAEDKMESSNKEKQKESSRSSPVNLPTRVQHTRRPLAEPRYKQNQRDHQQPPSEEQLSDKMKAASISQSREPKRYSSLRQRTTDSPSEPSRSQRFPLPPTTLPEEWSKKKEASTKLQYRTSTVMQDPQNTGVRRETDHSASERGERVINKYKSEQDRAFSKPATKVAAQVPQSVSPAIPPFSAADYTQQMADLQKAAESLPHTDAPTLTPMQMYEAALAYQQMINQPMISQPPPSLPQAQLLTHDHSTLMNAMQSHEQVTTSGLMLGEEQKLGNPQTQVPLGSRATNPDLGGLGSLNFPPPTIPHNFNQNDYIQRTMFNTERPLIAPVQIPFSHSPGLLGQQVGGVTYYPNLPPTAVPSISGVPNIGQVNTPIGSPLRNQSSAIPIRPPME